jgi:hypothetical protein
MKYIFILYCVMGCELSHPNHRIFGAYSTIEGCRDAKETAEIGRAIYSCERVSLWPF